MTWIRTQNGSRIVNSAQCTVVYIQADYASWAIVADLAGTSGCDGSFSAPSATLASYVDLAAAQDVLSGLYNALGRSAQTFTMPAGAPLEIPTP